MRKSKYTCKYKNIHYILYIIHILYIIFVLCNMESEAVHNILAGRDANLVMQIWRRNWDFISQKLNQLSRGVVLKAWSLNQQHWWDLLVMQFSGLTQDLLNQKPRCWDPENYCYEASRWFWCVLRFQNWSDLIFTGWTCWISAGFLNWNLFAWALFISIGVYCVDTYVCIDK